ncbi:hypothetical protein FK220_014885 [Flavobacteriaceae bacterium TP-CH-4]|uniref:Fibronectin type-III domain-containing protein n=1 Tax=Pelagihabitans pacificus TaxID=2696054 RepID=A0A967AVB1_9FLAO|nr:hypothetical protein [Pelagihabitans pacificus]NHF60639.1 hypothetical protein [Pelagihabitans pacificus]
MRKILTILILGMLLVACKKDPKPPSAVSLVAPAKNNECNPIESVSGNKSVVAFRWQAGANAESYELRVTNLITNTTQTKTTSALSETLTLDQGAPFSWTVISKNSEVAETAVSETWFFYNPGSLTTFAPFPAEILQPLPGGRVFMDTDNEVTLEWSGADLDGDIEGYDLYFSLETPPQTLLASPTAGTTSQKVSVSGNTFYYWRVITKDREGNTSDSGILSFKVL